MVWYENIKFYDITNYFEGKSLKSFVNDWIKSTTKDIILSKF
jgi:hypothetical protein